VSLARFSCGESGVPEQGSSESLGKLVNPPYVHSVDVSADGARVAAALGDGGVVVIGTFGILHGLC
jgi:hypothetical protein